MAKAIHSMIRVLGEAPSVEFCRRDFWLKAADRLDFDAFMLICESNAETGVELELTVDKDPTEPCDPGDGYGHLAVSVTDLDAEHARFEAEGLSPRKLVAFAPGGTLIGRFFFVADPDGYQIDVPEHGRGFAAGNERETLSLGLSFMAAFPDPWARGREFTTALDHYENMAGMWIVGEDMPQEANRVTLNHAVTDRFGMPVANVNYSDHPNDKAMRAHAYRQGQAMYDAVGATRTLPTPPYPSTHNLGTNRMSENARDGVVNLWGQTHDIANLFVSDGSQFTTGAAENATLTIVALAIRQADHIASEMSKGSL